MAYPLGTFPGLRMRRMRREEFSRRLMREHVLTTNDLIYPVFVMDGTGRTEPVRYSCEVCTATPGRAVWSRRRAVLAVRLPEPSSDETRSQ